MPIDENEGWPVEEPEMMLCESCDEVIVDKAKGLYAASVGHASGRWLCGSCSSLEYLTGMSVERARKALGGGRGPARRS